MLGLKFLVLLVVGALAVQEYQYGVLIDAGSSKTQSSVFKWPTRRDAVIPEIDVSSPMVVTKVKIPVTKILTNSTVYDGIFPTLLQSAKNQIPSQYWSTTRLFVRATAGVRTLSAANQITVIAKIRDYLRTSPLNPFIYANDTVQTLSGEEEGIYAWISNNYLASTLGYGPSTIATLELGGASAQVSFVPTESPIGELFPLKMGDRSYNAYTHSYLNYGQDTMEARYRQALVDAAPGASINDPCGFTGVDISYTTSYPAFYHGPANQVFHGTANRTACKALVAALLDQPSSCPQMPCAVAGVYQPDIPENMQVVAFSAFTYSAAFFGCGGHSNLTCLSNQVEAFYAHYLNISMLHDDFGSANDIYTLRYPLYATWVEALLKTGFRLSETRDIWFPLTMGPASWELTWSLGADAFLEAGVSPPVPYTADMWTGGWSNAHYGVDVLYICANAVTRVTSGSYLIGYMDGQLSTNLATFEGKWHEPDDSRSQGSFSLTLSPSGTSFSGYFRANDDEAPIPWTATRVSATTPTAQQCWLPAASNVNSSLIGHFQEVNNSKSHLDYMTAPYGYGYASYTNGLGYEEGLALGNTTAILHYTDNTGSGSVIRRSLADGTVMEFWFSGLGTNSFNNKTCWAENHCGWVQWVKIDGTPSKSLASALRPVTAQSGLVAAVAAVAAVLFVALVAIVIWICWCCCCRKPAGRGAKSDIPLTNVSPAVSPA
ncbi:putative Ectonucleoside triphosphate diphosphohydrolase 3 [Paratrimastix pyriformis]|uniref:Ectonucleoside triphosphate diphosphohydrolase 3 n=1 Tax=Paratrimastix pyriformis TaxID=342808 RepID=A0ABQ8U6D5_9EUKA|nr:putative Ectonucleoside triphosphate diphosphohydrolase 3 [Paratrimastix pyriformis]